jgi:histidinol phosphatase-like enzyme
MTRHCSAALIDRDGTIIKLPDTSGRDSYFELLPTVAEGISLLNQNGIKVVLMVSPGHPSDGLPAESAPVQTLVAELAKKNAHVDDVLYYPAETIINSLVNPIGSFRLQETLEKHKIDMSASYFVGDTFQDIETAGGLGCSRIIVPGRLPELELLFNGKHDSRNIDFASRDFISASRWILANALQMNDVSIIIPTKNEEHNLPLILPFLPKSAEIIMVDGGSTDNTVKVAQSLRRDSIIIKQRGTGKGNALKEGFDQASRDFIITYDADGSFRPGEVYKLIEKLRAGFDLVKGSRFIPGGSSLDMPPIRVAGNWVLTRLANVLYGSTYTDLVYGLHAIRRSAMNQILLHSEGFEMDAELYLRASRMGLKIAEIPSNENCRIYGKGKLNSFRDGTRILITILRECSRG